MASMGEGRVSGGFFLKCLGLCHYLEGVADVGGGGGGAGGGGGGGV